MSRRNRQRERNNGHGQNGAALMRLQSHSRQLKEAIDLLDDYIDPRDVYNDDGRFWQGASGALPTDIWNGFAYANEQQLSDVRGLVRVLATHNEFVQGCIKTRIAYIVGTGHQYKAIARKDQDVPDELLVRVQAVVDRFLWLNSWGKRQKEIVRRNDRDGETFLRFSEKDSDGFIRIRFVEPSQVFTPLTYFMDPNATFGIKTEPDDVETVLEYYIDGVPVPAAEIQHRKVNCDLNHKRGIPSFWSCRKNLDRVEKIQRNTAATTEIQAAIAMVRKTANATAAAVQDMVTARADVRVTNPQTGKVNNIVQYRPGTILYHGKDDETEFPAAGIDVSKTVQAVQGILRAVAARFVMPEFMLTADASNANYSSTMVAEGPSTKNFEDEQADMMAYDREIIDRQIQRKIDRGELPADVMELVEIEVTPPQVAVRDKLQEVQKDNLLVLAGAMSVQTLCARQGLDYDQEMENKLAHDEQFGALVTGEVPPGEDEDSASAA